MGGIQAEKQAGKQAEKQAILMADKVPCQKKSHSRLDKKCVGKYNVQLHWKHSAFFIPKNIKEQQSSFFLSKVILMMFSIDIRRKKKEKKNSSSGKRLCKQCVLMWICQCVNSTATKGLY
jgi:hypothetical protein